MKMPAHERARAGGRVFLPFLNMLLSPCENWHGRKKEVKGRCGRGATKGVDAPRTPGRATRIHDIIVSAETEGRTGPFDSTDAGCQVPTLYLAACEIHAVERIACLSIVRKSSSGRQLLECNAIYLLARKSRRQQATESLIRLHMAGS